MSKIHLVNIEVRELFKRPFNLALENLSPEVTIVYGPNASGKSSLSAAACRIFNQTHSHETDRILATLHIEGTTHQTQLRGKTLESQVPQSSRADLYRLSIPDLIIGPNSEDTAAIRNALSGGIDLVKLLDRSSPRPPTLHVADLDKKKVEASQISKQEERLVGLAEDKNRLQSRVKDQSALNRVLEAAELESGIAELTRQKDEICSQYPGINKQSLNAVQELSEALESYKDAVEATHSALSRLQSYKDTRSPRVLDAFDKQTLGSHRTNLLLLGPEVTNAQYALDTAISERTKLFDSLPAIGISMKKLEPINRQLLEELIGNYEDIKAEIKEQFVRVQESRRSLSQARTSFGEIGDDLGDLPIVNANDDEIQVLIGLDAEISQARSDLHRVLAELEVALATVATAESQLPGLKVPTEEFYGEFSRQPTIASLADQVRAAKTLLDAFQKAAEKLKESQSTTFSEDDAESAVRGLSDWIKAIPRTASETDQRSLTWLAVGSGVIALIIGFAIKSPVGSTIGALSLFALAVLLSRGKANQLPRDDRPEIQNRIPTTWRPPDWSVTAVVNNLERALNEISEEQALVGTIQLVQAQSDLVDIASLESALNDRLDAIQNQTGLKIEDPYELAGMIGRLSQIYDAHAMLAKSKSAKKSTEDALESKLNERRRIIEKIGAPVDSGASARDWITRLRKCHSAQADLDRLEEAHQSLVAGENEVARKLVAFFESYDWPSDGDLCTAKSGFLDWQRTSAEISAADKEIAIKETTLRKFQESVADIESSILEIFAIYGFPIDIDPINGLSVFEQWFELSDVLRDAERIQQAKLEYLRAKLEENGIPEAPEIEIRCNQASMRAEVRQRVALIDEEINEKVIGARAQRSGIDGHLLAKYGLNESSDIDSIEKVVAVLQEASDELETVQDEITEITSKILVATTSSDLIGAQRTLDDSINKAEIWIQKKAQSSANEKVRHAIDKAVRAENTPEVVGNCNSWLSRLTQNRYGNLEIAESNLTIYDRDDANRRKLVTELSTGTKAHLGLAVRLGVIEASETQGVKFPLFLDEVMATSDPDGSKAIAEALREISKDRQIVVMTNQPDDLSVLRNALGEDVMVITLDKTGPIPVEPPKKAPEVAPKSPLGDLPLHIPVLRWPAYILHPLLPNLDPALDTVGAACSVMGNGEYDEILTALEDIRSMVGEFFPVLSWEIIAGMEMGGTVMQQKIRAAFDESLGNPEDFIRKVYSIPGRRLATVDSLKEDLSNYGFFQEPPSYDQLVTAALSALPESLPSRMLIAQGLASFFRKYASS